MNSFDRVIYIDFETNNELNDTIVKTLAIELMGKHSNIVLYTKENNKIIDSLRHLNIEDNSSRNIGPGYTYESITSNKKDITTIPSFEEFLRLYNIHYPEFLEDHNNSKQYLTSHLQELFHF